MTRSKVTKIIILLVLAGAVWAAKEYLGIDLRGSGSGSPATVAAPTAAPETGGRASTATLDDTAILDAFRNRVSGIMVESGGTVVKSLPDDDEGSRHQRFIVRLASGHTVLIAHNIDLAPRAPVREGEIVEFKGQYEWSDKGGVIHWTHHDPAKRHEEGWIRVGGKTFD